MHRTMIALFVLVLASCEEAQPPVRTKAPGTTPASPAETAPPAMRKDAPPPPPPPAEPPKTAAPVPKVLLDPSLPEWRVRAPDEFKAKFTTSQGDFTILVKREWSPNGADRFYALVKNGYYNEVRFFRVIAGFMAQFGIHGQPEVNSAWKNAAIPDDPVIQSNKRGMVTYAKRNVPNTRTTQIFINFRDNSRLDGDGFSPFGQIIEGMEVVDKLYSGFGEGAPGGHGPNQGMLQAQGNEYLNREFKELDYVKTARIVEP